MDMCGKNQEKILRLQFQKRLNNKKVIREISNLLENFVWFNIVFIRFRFQHIRQSIMAISIHQNENI